MSKLNRSVHYITSIPNTIEGLKILADLREALKRKGLGTRVYGRCKNKRKVFGKNERRYFNMTQYENFKNDISLKSAEATDCYEWAVYFRPKRQRIVKPENVIEVPQFGGDTGIDADFHPTPYTQHDIFRKEQLEEAFR